jgi:hypothetical protein
MAIQFHLPVGADEPELRVLDDDSGRGASRAIRWWVASAG